MGEIIVVSSQKGGVGKTTTVVNLGTSLAILGQKTLLLDLDPQGSIANSFNIDEYKISKGLYEVIVKKLPLAMAVTEIGLENLEMVPTNVHNEDQEIDLFTHALKIDLLKTILKPLKANYDYILIDCPPNLGTLTLNGLVAADSVIIPVQPEFYALKALGKFLRSVKKIGSKYNKGLIFKGILITMFDRRLKKSKEIVAELQSTFRDLMFRTVVPRNSRVAEAPAYGKPLALLDINSPGAIAYFRLAEEIMSKKVGE
ncbi:MAG TPA: ParA family protein [Caldithrix abyssi]|uniref:ParA family protein n=1 Tax=Caldithrix abyssi TaxID=187145 RepID=A0A7V5PQE4_CALAY|nr:ParA family protein [Caldithrix abyssi]